MSADPVILSKLTPMIPSGADMSATLSFYQNTLGFELTYKAPDLGLGILQRSGAEIMISNSDDPHTASQTSFRIQVSDVNALYAEYQTKGIPAFEIEGGAGLGRVQTMPWGTREFPVRDLAGVCITFYQRLS